MLKQLNSFTEQGGWLDGTQYAKGWYAEILLYRTQTSIFTLTKSNNSKTCVVISAFIYLIIERLL